MKKILFIFSLLIAGIASQAQGPAGSKLAAEQAFTKEISRVFAYQKDHPELNASTSIKAPSLGQSGILTLTFNQITPEGNCREVTTIPVDKIISIIADSTLGFRLANDEVQKIRLCSGKQPSHRKENTLLIGMISDEAAIKGLAKDLETALRQLQTFYK